VTLIACSCDRQLQETEDFQAFLPVRRNARPRVDTHAGLVLLFGRLRFHSTGVVLPAVERRPQEDE